LPLEIGDRLDKLANVVERANDFLIPCDDASSEARAIIILSKVRGLNSIFYVQNDFINIHFTTYT
jgi:hypothetical protein